MGAVIPFPVAGGGVSKGALAAASKPLIGARLSPFCRESEWKESLQPIVG
jgi:hypothetical protein